MKNLALARLALPLLLLLNAACEDTSDDPDGQGGSNGEDTDDAPKSWLGAEPHVDLVGTVAEQELELVAESSDAADIGTVYCERNYIVPSLDDESSFADGYLQKVELKFNFFYLDALAEFQIELEADDLPDQVGKTLNIGDDQDAAIALGLNVDEDGPNTQEFEDAASGGTLKLELLSGEPGQDGVIVPSGEGEYGAHLDIELESGGFLQGSFTIKCGDNDLEVPE